MPALTLAPETSSVAVARRYVGGLLADGGIRDASVEDAILATSELVTNAVVHAATRVEVRVEIADRDVAGGGRRRRRRLPRVRPVVPDSVRGHGLMVVSQVAARWGVDLESDRKSVWFELPRPALPPSRNRRPLPNRMLRPVVRVIRRLPRSGSR